MQDTVKNGCLALPYHIAISRHNSDFLTTLVECRKFLPFSYIVSLLLIVKLAFATLLIDSLSAKQCQIKILATYAKYLSVKQMQRTFHL